MNSLTPTICTELDRILPHFTEITSLVLAWFPVYFFRFEAFKKVQSISLIGLGRRLHLLEWDGFVEFLEVHQPRAIHIESCRFAIPSNQEIQRTRPLIQPTTLSLHDADDEMTWMEGISPAFPNVTSLCITSGLLSVVAEFTSLRNLTLTDPYELSNCTPFPPNHTYLD